MADNQPIISPSEEWRDIPGWEGYYQASNCGRIRSVEREVHHVDGRVRELQSKVLKPRTTPQGRPAVNLCRGGKCKNHTIHSLVMSAFFGSRPEGKIIRHLNDDPWDNRLSNLAYGSHHENMWDCIANGGHHELNKTHCPRGHELAIWNTTRATRKKGYRDCLSCNRARARIQKNPTLDLKAVSDFYYKDLVSRNGDSS